MAGRRMVAAVRHRPLEPVKVPSPPANAGKRMKKKGQTIFVPQSVLSYLRAFSDPLRQ